MYLGWKRWTFSSASAVSHYQDDAVRIIRGAEPANLYSFGPTPAIGIDFFLNLEKFNNFYFIDW